MKTKMIAALAAFAATSGAYAQEAQAPAVDPAAPVTAAPASETPAPAPAAGPAATAAAEAGPISAPPAGKGQVVFFRRGTIMGAAISCAVSENGQKLSSLPPGKFAVVTVDPGVHEFTVSSEATDKLRLEIEPDETYYAKCNIGMGIMAGRPNLSPADKAAFDAMSKKLKPVKKS